MKLIEKLSMYSSLAAEDLGGELSFVNVRSGDVLKSLDASESDIGVAVRTHGVGNTLCGRVIEYETALAITDASQIEEYRDIAYADSGRIVGFLGVPVRLEQHGVVGSLNLITSEPREWKPIEQKYLERLSECIQLTIEKEWADFFVDELSSQLTSQDALAMLLASEIVELISVYDVHGELIFSSNALSRLLDRNHIANLVSRTFGAKRMDEFDLAEPRFLEAAFNRSVFGAKVSQTLSGLILCEWKPLVSNYH